MQQPNTPSYIRVDTATMAYIVMVGFCTDVIDLQTGCHRRTHPAMGKKYAGVLITKTGKQEIVDRIPTKGERVCFQAGSAAPFITGTVTHVQYR